MMISQAVISNLMPLHLPLLLPLEFRPKQVPRESLLVQVPDLLLVLKLKQATVEGWLYSYTLSAG